MTPRASDRQVAAENKGGRGRRDEFELSGGGGGDTGRGGDISTGTEKGSTMGRARQGEIRGERDRKLRGVTGRVVREWGRARGRGGDGGIREMKRRGG